MLAIDEIAPDLQVTTHLGFSGPLSEFWREGNLVLFFYPKDNTRVCTKEACSLQSSLADYGKIGAKVVGASLDSIASHQKFAERNGISFPLISDQGGKLAEAYGALRNMILMKLAKRITYVIGTDGKIKGRCHDEFKVETHLAMISETLNRHSAGV
jgi:peroxiredoxin Q/BCP